MIGKHRKKPVVVEAVQYKGTSKTGWNHEEIRSFVVAGGGILDNVSPHGGGGVIRTLEGPMVFLNDDWIIKGTRGEFYPCKPNVFEDVYENA